MIKKLQIISLIMILMVLLIASCAPKPAPAPAIEEPKAVAVPEEVPTTGEASVDEVATDISDTSNIDDELDTSELDDVDDILADIENI